MRSTVYLESTVISYYSARQSRDLIVAAHQQITINWWENVLPNLDAFISQVVLDEISQGDPTASQARYDSIKGFPLLEMKNEIVELAEEYFTAIQIPETKRADAFHLALAVRHGMDYLVTWNCTHIAGARVRSIIEKINSQHGIESPVICTPEELMEL